MTGTGLDVNDIVKDYSQHELTLNRRLRWDTCDFLCPEERNTPAVLEGTVKHQLRQSDTLLPQRT